MILAASIANGQITGRAVVGYYPDWSKGAYPHTAIPYKNLTHVVQSFLIPNADGSLGGTSGFAYPGLIQSAHLAGVKVIVSLGGWGQSDGFSPMAADTAVRHRFVSNIVAFCIANGYDGVDLDWEYPATTADRSNLTLLVHEIRQAFNALTPYRSISLAVPAGNWSGKWFDFAAMVADIDWYGIMTYDFYGSWSTTSGPNSPLYGNWSTNTQGWIDDSFTYYSITRAIPKAKLLVGVPFYGWVFNSSTMYGPSTGASQKPYQTIAPYLSQGWTRSWDSQGQIPYMINPGATQVISYEDTASIASKCDYVLQKGIPGVIIWAIGQDYLSGGQPLLEAIGRGLGLVTGIDVSSVGMPPPTSELLQNYPNPFNPATVIRYAVAGARGWGLGTINVRLAVYDLLGREVAVLVNESKPPGNYEVAFNAAGLASGVYFYRLTTGNFVQTRSMVVLH
jgi:chitinase